MIKSKYNKHLEKFKDIHKNKTAILFATGPSILKYNKLNDSENFIKIGLNTIYNYPEILNELNYYFYGSHYYVNDSHRENIEKICMNKNIITFASAYEDGRSHKDINRGNIAPERARELGSYPFENNSREVFTNDIANYSTCGGSIVFPAIQHILYMGFNKIYLVGCDGGFTANPKCSDTLIKWWGKFIEFKKIYYPNVEIFSINPDCLKGKFKDIYTYQILYNQP
jgi:hypothetical protein